jgi:hypothetical protein
MINSVVLAGKLLEVCNSCDTNTLAVVEVDKEQYFVLFDNRTLPEPQKLTNKYVCVYGNLQKFKYKKFKKEDFSVVTGVFVRRLEVYDI